MPVVPIMAAVGTAFGASAATAAAVGTTISLTAASVAAQGYSMYKSNQVAKAGAADARAVADYNSRVDQAEGAQIEMDSEGNSRSSRHDASVYLSRQKAAYAASGVLMSGSPLSVQATTAGRLEQQILQERSNAQREVAKRQSSARMGILYGDATARGITGQNRVDLLRGGANMLSTVGNSYQSGIFTKAPGANTGAGMLAAGAPAALAARSGT